MFFTKEELFIGINQVHAPFADHFFSWITWLGDGWAFGVMLAVLLAMRKYRLFLMGGITLLLVALFVQVLKHKLGAPRPMAYFTDTSIIHTVEWVRVHKSLSFPSGHTATAFAMCCFLAMTLRNKTASLCLFVVALVAGWSRIYLAQHFFEDVYIGSMIGTFSCMLVLFAFHLMKGRTPRSGRLRETEPAIPAQGIGAMA
ncbi:phosphatase PAP2 family protein [Chitinophaga horti]|uniref:Phosphatase PAP2 family protein n=1 Tax=Chitinophaga horti TaxID=2920382 RepID=A0ABY6J0Z9_9BACT|nr:phosphatase PAP2 family protein [Chitinophaga horti]UYQ93349.1 phosphatase PAP2 family protein [Chitinophaga horti]